jgi:choline dehydrogenase-like flavoprotein
LLKVEPRVRSIHDVLPHTRINSSLIPGPTTLLTARKEIILAAGVVGSPFILLHSGIGNATELQSLGIKPLVNLPSVGRNLSDHAVVPTAWPVNTTDTIETWVRDPKFVASALAEWRANKTGPYVDIPLVQLGWVRVPDEGGVLANGGDPAAGPNTPHAELIISVCLFSNPFCEFGRDLIHKF